MGASQFSDITEIEVYNGGDTVGGDEVSVVIRMLRDPSGICRCLRLQRILLLIVQEKKHEEGSFHGPGEVSKVDTTVPPPSCVTLFSSYCPLFHRSFSEGDV